MVRRSSQRPCKTCERVLGLVARLILLRERRTCPADAWRRQRDPVHPVIGSDPPPRRARGRVRTLPRAGSGATASSRGALAAAVQGAKQDPSSRATVAVHCDHDSGPRHRRRSPLTASRRDRLRRSRRPRRESAPMRKRSTQGNRLPRGRCCSVLPSYPTTCLRGRWQCRCGFVVERGDNPGLS